MTREEQAIHDAAINKRNLEVQEVRALTFQYDNKLSEAEMDFIRCQWSKFKHKPLYIKFPNNEEKKIVWTGLGI